MIKGKELISKYFDEDNYKKEIDNLVKYTKKIFINYGEVIRIETNHLILKERLEQIQERIREEQEEVEVKDMFHEGFIQGLISAQSYLRN